MVPCTGSASWHVCICACVHLFTCAVGLLRSRLGTRAPRGPHVTLPLRILTLTFQFGPAGVSRLMTSRRTCVQRIAIKLFVANASAAFAKHRGRPQTDADMEETWRHEDGVLKRLQSSSSTVPVAIYYGSGHERDARTIVEGVGKAWWIAQEELKETLEEMLTKRLVGSLLLMARALMALHASGRSHGDIHRGNYMFKNGGKDAVLIDFGETKESPSGHRKDVSDFGGRVMVPLPVKSEFTSRSDAHVLGALTDIAEACKNRSGFPSLRAADLVHRLECVSFHQFDALRSLPAAEAPYSTVRCKHSDLVLDVPGYSREAGTAITQWAAHGGDNQLFRLEAPDGGYGPLRCKNSKLVLDVCGASKDGGAAIIQHPETGGDNQLFRFEAIPALRGPQVRGPGPGPVLDGGWGYLRCKDSGLVLDVAGESTKDGATLCQFKAHGGDNQLFRFDSK